jgi:hypothetical protein
LVVRHERFEGQLTSFDHGIVSWRDAARRCENVSSRSVIGSEAITGVGLLLFEHSVETDDPTLRMVSTRAPER